MYLEQLYTKIGVPIKCYPRRGKLLTRGHPRAQQANTFSAFGERVPPRVTHFPKNPRPLKRSFAMLGTMHHSQLSCIALSTPHIQISTGRSSQCVLRPCVPLVVPLHPTCSNGWIRKCSLELRRQSSKISSSGVNAVSSQRAGHLDCTIAATKSLT